ncbi:hypothetical protein Dimus_006352 [Dionaea muscipula]
MRFTSTGRTSRWSSPCSTARRWIDPLLADELIHCSLPAKLDAAARCPACRCSQPSGARRAAARRLIQCLQTCYSPATTTHKTEPMLTEGLLRLPARRWSFFAEDVLNCCLLHKLVACFFPKSLAAEVALHGCAATKWAAWGSLLPAAHRAGRRRVLIARRWIDPLLVDELIHRSLPAELDAVARCSSVSSLATFTAGVRCSPIDPSACRLAIRRPPLLTRRSRCSPKAYLRLLARRWSFLLEDVFELSLLACVLHSMEESGRRDAH